MHCPVTWTHFFRFKAERKGQNAFGAVDTFSADRDSATHCRTGLAFPGTFVVILTPIGRRLQASTAG